MVALRVVALPSVGFNVVDLQSNQGNDCMMRTNIIPCRDNSDNMNYDLEMFKFVEKNRD